MSAQGPNQQRQLDRLRTQAEEAEVLRWKRLATMWAKRALAAESELALLEARPIGKAA